MADTPLESESTCRINDVLSMVSASTRKALNNASGYKSEHSIFSRDLIRKTFPCFRHGRQCQQARADLSIAGVGQSFQLHGGRRPMKVESRMGPCNRSLDSGFAGIYPDSKRVIIMRCPGTLKRRMKNCLGSMLV